MHNRRWRLNLDDNVRGALLRDVVVGVGAPILLSLVLELAEDPVSLRPGGLLLVMIVAIGAFVGTRCALVAAVMSTILMWWEYADPRFSFRVDGVRPALGVLLFAVGAWIAISLVGRMQAAQKREADGRRLFEAVIEHAPIGMALFDRSMRFIVVNEKLADANGSPAAAHLGRRPSEVNPATGGPHEALLHQVLETRRPILDHQLSSDIGDTGERHWKVSYYPILADDRLIAVGCTAEDVTADEIGRRRTELLALLARELSMALSHDAIAESTCRFLAEAFSCRAAMAFVDPSRSVLVVHPSLRGYSDEITTSWAGREISLDDPTPFAQAARSIATISVLSLTDFESRNPPQVTANMRATGDQSSAWVPVADPDDSSRALAVYRMAWPKPDNPMATAHDLQNTVAAIVALAIRRVELSEAALLDRFRGALDAMLDAVAITRAVRDDEGEIVDFEILFANARSIDGAGRAAQELVGGRLCELYPAIRTSSLFASFRRVVETGEPFIQDAIHYQDVTDKGPIDVYWSIQAVKFDDGYISSTRDMTAVVRARELATEAERLAQEHRVTARVVQRAALPDPLPKIEGGVVTAHHRPIESDQPIGGDWYDVIVLGPRRVGLVIADVAGHGSEAATTMLSVRHIVRAAAAQLQDPGAVLTEANTVVRRLAGPDAPFTTCCYALADLDQSTLQWSRAGHFDPLVVSATGAGYLQSDGGPPLGVLDDHTFTTSSAALPAGTSVVLFTDGLVERRDQTLDAGLDALIGNAEALRDRDGVIQVAELAESVPDPRDDIAIIALQHSA